MRVSELATLIDQALRLGVPARVNVIGEISGLRDRTHLYFDLKDDQAVVNCVLFASAARALGFRPENGTEVVARGRVEFYGRQGKTQLYVDRLSLVGQGELELRLRTLCAELKELGYFDVDHKRPLPVFPRRIAIVTSRTGAALQDVLDTMRRRCPAIEAAIVDVRVQGERAGAEIADALRWLSDEHKRLGIDAIILTRGGGSMEDLWAFNERIVADAVYACEVPIVAAIGHETDTTVAELVADERAATPTQAAMRLTPDRSALIEQVEQTRRRLAVNLQRFFAHERERLRGLTRSPLFADPRTLVLRAVDRWANAERRLRSSIGSRIARESVRIERLSARIGRARPEVFYRERHVRLERAGAILRRAMRTRLASYTPDADRERLERAWAIASAWRIERLNSLERELAVAGPLSVLRRGYSMTTRPDGTIIRRAADVRPGEIILTRVLDGQFQSTVDAEGTRSPTTTGDSGEAPPLPPRHRSRGVRRASGREPDPGQMGLF